MEVVAVVARVVAGLPLLLIGLAHVFAPEAPMRPLVEAAGFPFPVVLAPAGVVAESHSVDVEAWRIGREDPEALPFGERDRCSLVAVPCLGVAWENETDGVHGVSGFEPGSALGIDDGERIIELDPLTGEIFDTEDAVGVWPAKHWVTTDERLADSGRPQTVLGWLAKERVGALLADLAAGGQELTHEALDALPPSPTLDHLRSVLVATGTLPPRDEHMARLERALDELLAGRDDHDEQQLLRRYAFWHLLRRLRRRFPRLLPPPRQRLCSRALDEFCGPVICRGAPP